MSAADAGAAGWNAAQNAPPEVQSAATDYATQQATAEVKKTCGLDMTYVKSINGILKLKQLVSVKLVPIVTQSASLMILGYMTDRV